MFTYRVNCWVSPMRGRTFNDSMFCFLNKREAWIQLVNYLVLLEAYNGLPAQIAMVINYLWPVVLMILSAPLLGQRITLKMAFASGISFCGIGVLAFGGNPVGGHLPLSAIGLVLASTVIWALFWILSIRASGDPVRNLAGKPRHEAGVLFGSGDGIWSRCEQHSYYRLALGLYTGKAGI